jgi:polyferredoxin
MLVFMMGMMTFMLSKNIASANHWGTVFWTMCAVTSLIGVTLGAFFKPRTWCAFCPIGTVQTLARKHQKKLTLESDNCKVCRLCEKKCPMNLDIIKQDKKEVINSHDCIKCSVCVNVCPTKALKFKKSA